jgi:hypothetical protein
MKLAGGRLGSISPAILIMEKAAYYFSMIRKSNKFIIPG